MPPATGELVIVVMFLKLVCEIQCSMGGEPIGHFLFWEWLLLSQLEILVDIRLPVVSPGQPCVDGCRESRVAFASAIDCHAVNTAEDLADLA
jgi:hypothetical protein